MLALRFYLGGRRFAAPARSLKAVLPAAELALVTGGPFWLAGLLTLHGRAVPVVDLGLASGGDPCPALYHTRILLVDLMHDGRTFAAGLLVERATDLAEVPEPQAVDAGFAAGPSAARFTVRRGPRSALSCRSGADVPARLARGDDRLYRRSKVNLTPFLLHLRRSTGLEAASLGEPAIRMAIEGRRRQLGTPTAETYYEVLTSDPREASALAEAVSVPETWLFRYPESFRYLAALAATPPWQRPRDGEPFRVLSLPCSTGEEAYSIAMTLRAAGLGPRYALVDGVDLNASSLVAARAGVFGAFAMREGLPPRLRGYARRGWPGTGRGSRVSRLHAGQPDRSRLRAESSGLPSHLLPQLVYLSGPQRPGGQVWKHWSGCWPPVAWVFVGHSESQDPTGESVRAGWAVRIVCLRPPGRARGRADALYLGRTYSPFGRLGPNPLPCRWSAQVRKSRLNNSCSNSRRPAGSSRPRPRVGPGSQPRRLPVAS